MAFCSDGEAGDVRKFWRQLGDGENWVAAARFARLAMTGGVRRVASCSDGEAGGARRFWRQLVGGDNWVATARFARLAMTGRGAASRDDN